MLLVSPDSETTSNEVRRRSETATTQPLGRRVGGLIPALPPAARPSLVWPVAEEVLTHEFGASTKLNFLIAKYRNTTPGTFTTTDVVEYLGSRGYPMSEAKTLQISLGQKLNRMAERGQVTAAGKFGKSKLWRFNP